MSPPNFFIVGAPKAGTTSLYAYLDQHPQVFMCPLKEPNHFADEMRPENFSDEERPRIEREMLALRQYLCGDLREKRFGGLVASWEDYQGLFRNVTDQIAVGEATPCYLWSQSAARNIAARIPHARIIINLRNPADRAFSQYLQMVTAGTIRRSFREQLEASRRCQHRKIGPLWPLLEFGLYYRQVKRYLEHFPRSQIHISFYEDLQRAPARLLSDLFAFLGVDQQFAADHSRRHHEPRIPRFGASVYFLKQWGLWTRLQQMAPHSLRRSLGPLVFRTHASLVMQAPDRAFLCDYYRDDVRELERLLGRDLSSWLCTGTAVPSGIAVRGALERR
jgi:hypothetical protein